MVASHNEDTVRYALHQMQLLNIRPEDKVRNLRKTSKAPPLSNDLHTIQPSLLSSPSHLQVICFGQLLGMCDNLSFPLGQYWLAVCCVLCAQLFYLELF